MPLIDFTNLLSDSQETAATEISDNVVDLQALAAAQQLGFVWVNCVVSVVFSGSATISVTLYHHSAVGVASGVAFLATQTFTSAAAGTVLMSLQIPLAFLDRYVGLNYTIGSWDSTGSVDAWIGLEPVNESLTIQAAQPTPSPS